MTYYSSQWSAAATKQKQERAQAAHEQAGGRGSSKTQRARPCALGDKRVGADLMGTGLAHGRCRRPHQPNPVRWRRRVRRGEGGTGLVRQETDSEGWYVNKPPTTPPWTGVVVPQAAMGLRRLSQAHKGATLSSVH